ncbi:transcription termination factor 1 [Misgurnus anguillicaudatus]|uniref:transcription termination factor 1 n=1 Tax=Misgurnus anguillicaudatus TaxID=75329 RepID=UPI003CCF1EE9
MDPEKIRKKKRKRETLGQQELVESLEEVEVAQNESEMQHEMLKTKKKKKKNKEIDTHTEKKKKKKKLKETVFNESTEETSLMDDTVNDTDSSTAQFKDVKKKKKKKKAKMTPSDMAEDHHEEDEYDVPTEQENVPCEEEEYDVPTEQENVPCEEDLGDPDIQIGTRKRKKRGETNGDLMSEVDEKLLNEIKEFIPHIETSYPLTMNKMIMYDLPRFKEFKKQGIALRHGRFSAEDNERLQQNVKDFLALTGVENPTKLFYTRRFPEEAQELTKIKKNHRFFERIAEGIPRSCYDVYFRGRRAFDGGNYKGRFTKEEVKELLKYQTIHGNNWQKISELTGRSSYALEKRFSQMGKKHGQWSDKEVQRLLRAVRDHLVTTLKSESPRKRPPTRVSREMLYRKLPWFKIADKVKTRCWSKCRDKWMSILAVRMSSGTVYRGRKSQDTKIRLIKAMYERQVEDVADVNWEELTTVFGDVPPAHVQLKWHQLKVSYVPNWQNKCFADIIDFLYENILPGLEKDCENPDENELKVDQQQSFLLSDIFQDIKDNDDDDDIEEEESGQR